MQIKPHYHHTLKYKLCSSFIACLLESVSWIPLTGLLPRSDGQRQGFKLSAAILNAFFFIDLAEFAEPLLVHDSMSLLSTVAEQIKNAIMIHPDGLDLLLGERFVVGANNRNLHAL